MLPAMAWSELDTVYECTRVTGRFRIVIDDGCYVVLTPQPDKGWQPTAWIFPEAFVALQTLPVPSRRIKQS